MRPQLAEVGSSMSPAAGATHLLLADFKVRHLGELLDVWWFDASCAACCPDSLTLPCCCERLECWPNAVLAAMKHLADAATQRLHCIDHCEAGFHTLVSDKARCEACGQ